jgi:hypothetical protein
MALGFLEAQSAQRVGDDVSNSSRQEAVRARKRDEA